MCLEVGLGDVPECLAHTQTREQSGHMGSAFVHDHHRPALDSNFFASASEHQRKRLARKRRRIAVNDVALFQMLWVGGRTILLYVGWARARYIVELCDTAGVQRKSWHRVCAYHTIQANASQIHCFDIHPKKDFDI